MDREYLEDYEQKEDAEYKRLVLKGRLENRFNFEEDRYPPDERFAKLQQPTAIVSGRGLDNFWGQVPLSGSLIIMLPALPKSVTERDLFKESEIPKIIEFIKETGRLQVVLAERPTMYAGLDHFDLIFKELKPPVCFSAPLSVFGTEKEIGDARQVFYTLAGVRFFDFLNEPSVLVSSRAIRIVIRKCLQTYIFLKIGHYAVVENIDNLLIDDPVKAMAMLNVCRDFITDPILDMRSNQHNFTLKEIRGIKLLPLVYQPQEIRFPCEIGKFLIKKLTYAPQGLRACNELIDHYDSCDLRKVQESLNEAIVRNHPDVINKSAEDLSEILDNVWNDKTIPVRVKGLQIGIPLSMAAIGSVAAGPIGATGGFLAGLGFSVVDKFIDLGAEGLSERLAKLKSKSYQANVYDFKEKYKHRIVK